MLPDNLEFVCDDANNSRWMYSGDKYYRLYPARKFTFISGVNLPDPEQLLQSRERNAIINGQIINYDIIKPTKAVYALWNHWQKVLASKKELCNNSN